MAPTYTCTHIYTHASAHLWLGTTHFCTHAHTHNKEGSGRRGTEFKMRTMKCYKCKEYMNLRTYNNKHPH